MQNIDATSHHIPDLRHYIEEIFQRPAEDLQSLSGEEFSRMLDKLRTYTHNLETEKEYPQIRTRQLLSALEFAADEVRERERSSYIGAILTFMHYWRGPDKGYARIISV